MIIRIDNLFELPLIVSLSLGTLRTGYSRTGTLKKKIVADRKALQDSHEDSANGVHQQNGLQGDPLISDRYAAEFAASLPAKLQAAGLQMDNARNGARREEVPRGPAHEDELPGDLNGGHYGEFNDGGQLDSYSVAGEIKKIDMKVIEPYTRVLSHAGYYTSRSDPNIGGRNSMTFFLFILLLLFLAIKLYKTLN